MSTLGARQRVTRPVRLLVELHEHEVPDLEPARAVLAVIRHALRALARGARRDRSGSRCTARTDPCRPSATSSSSPWSPPAAGGQSSSARGARRTAGSAPRPPTGPALRPAHACRPNTSHQYPEGTAMQRKPGTKIARGSREENRNPRSLICARHHCPPQGHPMPTYHVEMLEGRTLEQKKKLVEEITRVTVEILGWLARQRRHLDHRCEARKLGHRRQAVERTAYVNLP